MTLPCSMCAAGALHGGTPTGKTTTLYDLPTYVAEPEGEAKGVVVIITDAFGYELPNNRILADSYAKKGGFKVLMPDFFNGHWLDHDLLNTMHTAMNAKQSFFARLPAGLKAVVGFLPFVFFNRFSVSGPRLYKWFAELRAATPATTKIGAAGFCWGGKWTTYLASPSWTSDSPTKGFWPAPGAKEGEYLVNAVYAAHPSMLDLPTDMERVKLPYSVAHASEDFGMKPEGAEAMKQILNNNKDCECVVYEGAEHGFAIRGDPNDEKVKQQGTQAEEQAIKWFTKYLA